MSHDSAAAADQGPAARCGLLHHGALVLFCVALATPAVLHAQQANRTGGSLGVEPRLGFWWDRLESDQNVEYADEPGRFGALRLTSSLTSRLRAVAGIGYARLDAAYVETVRRPNGDVLTATTRREHVPVTAGVDLDLNGGRTVVSLGLEAGADWSRSLVTSRTGPPPIDVHADEMSRSWGIGLAVIPSITVRRSVSSGLDLAVSLQTFNGSGNLERGDFLRTPAATFGVRWSMR